MSSTISTFFRKAFTLTPAKPLSGRAISAPRPLASGLSRVSATDFSKARDMVNPHLGQSAAWKAVSSELRHALIDEVIPHPVARQANIAFPGHLVLVNARHQGRHLSAADRRDLIGRHGLVPVGRQVSLSSRDGGRHTFTWAVPAALYAEAQAQLLPKPAVAAPRARLGGQVLGMGGLEGPSRGSAALLNLPSARTYLGRNQGGV